MRPVDLGPLDMLDLVVAGLSHYQRLYCKKPKASIRDNLYLDILQRGASQIPALILNKEFSGFKPLTALYM